MAFERTFDEIYNQILTDFRNILPGVDTSQGSLAAMKAAAYASALWGLHKYIEWMGRQAFPDTSDTDALNHHGWVRGVARLTDENNKPYLDRLLGYIREPPAGGNKHDYVTWAEEVEGVSKAWSIPLAQGGESVDVIIKANADTTGSAVPSETLLATVLAYIQDLRPTSARFVRVLAPTEQLQDIVMTGVDDALVDGVETDIANYMNALEPGESLYPSQLVAIAIIRGANNPIVTTPAAAVEVEGTVMIRPGTISVSA